ncbi:ABC transporter permease [Aquiflexum gelatinilyticum]|uniref:ABC transporter permease n=1 Tax=Aquiflexum gelatinilyticum TaxID=2961943 RepID=UPI002167E95A|nr:ABC transporter permease [Aquiflexum gelatinilyticum]MCS4435296.1 ABC transporter permease [Aquiflexum gelatinilyticum]
MFANYLKIAIRGFAKHKLTFFINLFGLALGLWAAILIGLWVKSELNMNRHFTEIDQVYRIMEHQKYGADIFTTTSTPGILADELKNVFPEVEKAATFSWHEEKLFAKEDTKIKLNGFFAGEDYLHILQYDLLHGNRETALAEKTHIVLTKEAAIKLFGKTDVIGETLLLKESEGETPFVVQGVLESIPNTSSTTLEYLLPFKFMSEKPYNSWLKEWGNNGPSTIVRLNKQTDWQAFSAKLENFILERNEGSNVKLFAYPQKELYLHGEFKDGIQQGGRIEYVKLFALIGLFVLLIACINFMNLSTAKSQKRAKEVGVRKVVGAEKGALVKQFLSESLLITFFASILALLLVQLTLPVFNDLTGKTMQIPYDDSNFWIQYLGVLLFTGLVAGSYPAFYLSATKVVSVFRSHTKSGKGVAIARKGLVLFQFILATILIVATVVVYQQINFALNQDLGYDKEQLLVIPLEGNLQENYDAFKNRLKQNPDIKSVSKSNHSLLGRNSNTGGVNWEGKDPEFNALFEIMRVDYDFLETTGMKLIHGEDFNPAKGADSVQGAIINRRAYELITNDNPEAVSFNMWGEERTITGVVEDFHFQSFHQNMEPVVILLDREFGSNGFVRLNTADIQTTIASIKALSEELNPDFPFQYTFMDENYANMYNEDVRIRDLAKYFSILKILISCLGLFGLSAHVAEQKTKEIGIRKVLGASTASILNVINREFIMIVAVSILIGSAVGYWLMQDWLSGYAYKIDFEWWFIPMAAGVILSIAYLTVTMQALKAAQINPANTLKSE